MTCGGSAGILTEMSLAMQYYTKAHHIHIMYNAILNMNVCVCMCVSYCTSSFIEQELHMESVY